jgi:hypothetical protein
MVAMRKPFVCLLAIASLAAACWLAAAPAAGISDLRQAFLHPPDDSRIMVRWWWFGPSVKKAELEREMRLMKEGGIGGFEVQPTYPMQVDGNFKYLSPEFLDNLAFTGAKAKELGLRMDLTLGSGWPFGGPHIPIEEAAGRLIVTSTPPKLADGDKLIAQSNGLYFVAGHTRQTVKRPAAGAEGWVLDHYDRAAVQTHLDKVGEPMLQALAKTPPTAIFSDSLEVYNSDWTRNFLAEFQKRRGYDLLPHIAALANNATGDDVLAIRHDWGKTLSELCDDNYLKPITQWAHDHHTLFRSQTYGIPPVTLSSYSYVDLPEGEGTQWRHFSTTRWATSASHLLGKPVTSSETWTWLHSPVFRATPLDMKAEADIHFLQGINQLVGHGFPYSPPEAGEPGWRFYAAAVLNEHNPWWLVMPDITGYLQRVSFLLRQGQPANDVALYLPTDDAFAHFTLAKDSVNQAIDGLIGDTVIPQILDAGYNFDFIDDGFIAKGGIPHRILILPNVERIPLATLQRIQDYARKGGTVIATRRLPSLAPGLQDAPDTPKIRQLVSTLRLLTDETKLGDTLHQALPADVATAPKIAFVHRKLPYAEIYFLANTSNHPVHHQAVFRVKDLASAWWNPFTGDVTRAGNSTLNLDLAPYESRIVVFSKDRVTAPTPTGPETVALDLSTNWKVTFPNAAPLEMPALASWPDKYYSGQATYDKTITVDRALASRTVFLNFGQGTPATAEPRRSGAGMRALLDSPVREAAVVYINGKRAGAVWCAPYELNITGLLHAGENSVRIVVANLALNEMAKGPLPDYKDLTAKYGERFQAQDMQLVQPQPSGLLDGVKLTTR